MKKIILVSLVTVGAINAQILNPEYQKMLDTRANILGIEKPQKPQEASQPLPVLAQTGETLNNQFTDLLQQLKNLDAPK